ncbi:hypothetical protein J7E29_11520 [Streptomyces sp. ISL-90]|nr:hypothetical protein [Streptomyces sp. ISL-90]
MTAEELEPQEVWNLVPLTPEFIETEHAGYAAAIREALKKNDVRNVALSGNYGVGKSSILRRVAHEHRGRVAELSLSTLAPMEYSALDDSVPAQATTPTNRIQQEIVKQLLYREEPRSARGSRFRRIERFSWGREIALSLLAGAVVALIFMILGWGTTVVSTLKPLVDFGLWIYVILIAVSAGAIMVARVLLHGRIHIRQFSAGPAAVTLDEKSVSYFDQYLDEIVYFFETSKRDIVIFEDIDRFNDSHIFETLRSLNTLLNASPQIEKPVRFIYAIKDSIFDRIGLEQEGRKTDKALADVTDPAQAEAIRANRTKFFDLVIPVVPFITHRSARNLTAQVLRGIEHEVSDDLIDLAGRFVPDMRLLKNVRNEFVVFRDRIFSGEGEQLELSETDLFAMMLYKSTHLSDFEDIRLGKSNLDRLYNSSRTLVTDNIRRVEREVRVARQEISRATLASSRAARLGKQLTARIDLMVRVMRLQRNSGRYMYDGRATTADELQAADFWREYATADEAPAVGWNNPSYGQSFSLSRSDVSALVSDPLNPDAWQEADQEAANDKIRELQAQLKFLRSADMGALMKRPEFLVDYDEVAQSLDSVAEKSLTKGLAFNLVRAGYIDRNFTLYTSTFHGDRVSPAATNFIIHHVERGLMDEHFALDGDDVEAVIRERGTQSLAEPALYNIAILDHLLLTENPAADVMLDALARFETEGHRFLQSYLTGGSHGERLIAKLTAGSPRVLAHLITDVELDDEARLALVSTCLENLSDTAKQRVGDATKRYLAANYPQISAMASSALSSAAARRLAQLFKDAGVVLPELGPVSQSVRPAFVELGVYETTFDNLRAALGEDAGLALDEIRGASREHVYAKVLAELPAYLTAVDGRSPSNATAVGFATVVTEVHQIAPTLVDRVVAAASDDSRILNIADVPQETWGVLARHDRFPSTYANVTRYIERLGAIDDSLEVLLASSEAISEFEEFEESDKQALAVTLISASDLLGQVLRAKLAESLNLKRFLAVSSLPVENGVLFAELISRQVIADGAATYEHLSGTDWPTRERVLGVSTNFGEWATPELVDGDLGPLLSSTAVADAAKRAIVARADEYAPLGGHQGLLELARLALAFGVTVSFPVIQQMALNRVPVANVLALLHPYVTTASDAQLFGVLRSLGGEYAQLTYVGRDKPKISNSPTSRALLEALQHRGIVASFDPAQNPMKVNKRYK